MAEKLRCAAIAVWLAATFVGNVCAQSAGQAAAVPDRMHVAPPQAEAGFDSSPEIFREIVDASTGDLWLLLRDPNHRGGPGRMALVRRHLSVQKTGIGNPVQPLLVSERPVIHTGDTVIVEEHTAVADARLEAVALGPAVKGAHFQARLKIGGEVAQVVAISPGHAALVPESEMKP